jgi:hypothetical protein
MHDVHRKRELPEFRLSEHIFVRGEMVHLLSEPVQKLDALEASHVLLYKILSVGYKVFASCKCYLHHTSQFMNLSEPSQRIRFRPDFSLLGIIIKNSGSLLFIK